MTAKLTDSNNSELMAINALERDGDDLLIKGKIYGAMPMTARLRPADAMAIMKLWNLRLIFFLVTLPFRRGSTRG